MARSQPEFRFTKEFDRAQRSTAAWLLLEKPITPLFSLYAQILREEAWNDSRTGTTTGWTGTGSAWGSGGS